MKVKAVRSAGGEIQAMNGDIEPADGFPVDRTAAEAVAADYDAVIMPGGTVNADRLRVDPHVRAAFRAGTPVEVICHGPWTLVEPIACGAAR